MIPGPQVFLSYIKLPQKTQPLSSRVHLSWHSTPPKSHQKIRNLSGGRDISLLVSLLNLAAHVDKATGLKVNQSFIWECLGNLRKNPGPFVQLSEKKNSLFNSVSRTWVEMSPSTLQAWFLPPFPSLPRCLPVLCVMGMSSGCVFLVVWNTVGGRNPAPPEMYKTWQIIMGDPLPIRWCRISAINRIIYILSCFEDANNRTLSSWHHFTNWRKNVQRTNCRKNKTWSQSVAQIMREMRAKQIIVNQMNTLPKGIQRYQPLGGP